MSIASEITRLQGVKADILQAISDKGVTVPAGSALDDCPALIASITDGDYETDFSNFDYVNKIDSPIKGFATFYDLNFGYSSDNGLKISSISNYSTGNRTFGFGVFNGSELKTTFRINCVSSQFAFLKVTENIAITYSPSEKSHLVVMVDDSYIKTISNMTFYQIAYGYEYYETSLDPSLFHELKVDYTDNYFNIYIDNIQLAQVNRNADFCQFFPDPRSNASINLSEIKFKK